MQNNITEMAAYIEHNLSEYDIEFNIYKNQENIYLYEVYSDFNIIGTIQVKDNKELNTIIICSNIHYKDRLTYSSELTIQDENKSSEEEVYNLITNFNDSLVVLNTVIDDIVSLINNIKSICQDNNLDCEDFIEDKM